MKKKVFIITQSKGGSGKSVLTFMLAVKYEEAMILDLDDATKTTMKQVAWREPTHVPFLDRETQRIDRGAFNGFFESIIESKKKLFIADLGTSVAEQLPKYFALNSVDSIIEILKSSNVDLKIVCVIGGENMFRETMGYAAELIKSTEGKLDITLAHNGRYPLSVEQESSFVGFSTENNVAITSFDLVKDKGEMAFRTVANVLREGKGIVGLSPFTAIYFKNSINELSL